VDADRPAEVVDDEAEGSSPSRSTRASMTLAKSASEY
jgi:hypothetical protein